MLVSVRNRIALLLWLTATLAATSASTLSAQDGVLSSARTIGHGRVALTAAGLLWTFRDDINATPRSPEGVDDVAGFIAHATYGLADRADIRAKFTAGEDIFNFGGDFRLDAVRAGTFDLAFGAGAHYERFHTDFSPVWFGMAGIDGTVVVSDRVQNHLTLYLATDVSAEFADVNLVRQRNDAVHLGHFTRVNLLPGAAYALGQRLHVVAEVAVKMNDKSYGYIAAGLMYFPR
jgi:ABC-type amino acid transport substrate-binding protein